MRKDGGEGCGLNFGRTGSGEAEEEDATHGGDVEKTTVLPPEETVDPPTGKRATKGVIPIETDGEKVKVAGEVAVEDGEVPGEEPPGEPVSPGLPSPAPSCGGSRTPAGREV